MSKIPYFNRQKDEVAGEVPVAFVVRSNGYELTEEAVKEFIAKQVQMNFCHPSIIITRKKKKKKKTNTHTSKPLRLC